MTTPDEPNDADMNDWPPSRPAAELAELMRSRNDRELNALQTIAAALDLLDDAARARVLRYVWARFVGGERP